MAQTQIPLRDFLEQVAARAREAGVFASVECSPSRVECAAQGAGAPAFYRVDAEGGTLWVSLATRDRWLSQSIEADLVHTGDSLGELIEEEWADLGGPRRSVTCEHFRSEDRHFTFRTKVGDVAALDGSAMDVAARMLLAYEACFRRLGDMNAEGEAE